MTYFGAKVLHFPAVLPAIAARIPLVIRNSFAPDGPGTTISAKGDPRTGIRAVTAMSGLCLISLDGKGMAGIPGIAARVFGTTARLGVSVVMFSQASSEQNIALVIPEGDRARTAAALGEFRYEELAGSIDGVATRRRSRSWPPSATGCAAPAASPRGSSTPSPRGGERRGDRPGVLRVQHLLRRRGEGPRGRRPRAPRGVGP